MSDNVNKVLRVNAVEETTRYRKAVSEILVNIQKDHHVTLHEISETIDVSLGTISNAANKKNDLSSTFLERLGKVYGPATLDPWAALCGARLVPLVKTGSADILTLTTRVSLAIAEARDPESEGGVVETHREKLGYLPHLRKLRRELDVAIGEIEEIAA